MTASQRNQRYIFIYEWIKARYDDPAIITPMKKAFYRKYFV